MPVLSLLGQLLTCFILAASAVHHALPDGPIIAAWQDWGRCNESQTLLAVERGVNVIFWFASNLVKVDGKPQITGPLPDLDCVARVRKSIEAKELDTRHLLTIGGWNAPHPDTSFTGEEWFHAWHTWNQGLALPFDGFDWDLEGNDWTRSRYNVFSSACMQLVVDMSSFAKKAGYLVTMAPVQSYFDVTTSKFNRFLNNSNEDYHPDFFYRGRNSYAYWWAAAPEGTFDLVTIQLYETYSPAMQALHSGISGEKYLQSYAAHFLKGWTVHFDDPTLPLQGDVKIQVPSSKLLLGLSFGSPPKWAFFWPAQVAAAYQAAKEAERPRGYSFWMIGFEDSFRNRSNGTLSFARGLNQFLHVRGGRTQDAERSCCKCGRDVSERPCVRFTSLRHATLTCQQDTFGKQRWFHSKGLATYPGVRPVQLDMFE